MFRHLMFEKKTFICLLYNTNVLVEASVKVNFFFHSNIKSDILIEHQAYWFYLIIEINIICYYVQY